MRTPGAVLLHELMHWRRLTQAHREIAITDWNAREKIPMLCLSLATGRESVASHLSDKADK